MQISGGRCQRLESRVAASPPRKVIQVSLGHEGEAKKWRTVGEASEGETCQTAAAWLQEHECLSAALSAEHHNALVYSCSSIGIHASVSEC